MQKLYVLACAKLKKAQQFVQGTHAALEYCREHGLNQHPIIVMLECPSIELYKELLKDYRHSEFRDSYYNYKLTAIAALNIGHLVKELKLL